MNSINLVYSQALSRELAERVGLALEDVFEVVGWEVYQEAQEKGTPVGDVVSNIDFDTWEFDFLF